MKLSILMPVYNERTVVERCISLVLTAPLPENMERELVIVDDCSTDGTYAILQRLAAAFPQIRLYQHPVNRGKGAAVRSAIEKASGDRWQMNKDVLHGILPKYPLVGTGLATHEWIYPPFSTLTDSTVGGMVADGLATATRRHAPTG